VSHRLGYLLKHANLRYEQLVTAELAPLGIGPREWAALLCLDEQNGLSQREVAELLGIDRTRMVGLVDELQEKGWVERRPHDDDRRKNIVTLTRTGRALKERGSRVMDRCEQRFLSVLDASDAEQLKSALDTLVERAR
jgi:DNA-binding MarR family transcriptional regulator